jgi:hypothetical protein
MSTNIDHHTVDGFGYEWSTFDQSDVSDLTTGQFFGISHARSQA